MLRTHTCGQLGKKEVGQTVKLAGWVHRRRDHGGLIFIDLRDRYGITQLTFDPKKNEEAWKEADRLRGEWVIQTEGIVTERPEEMINKKIATGEIEIEASNINVYSQAKTPPFEIEEEKETEVSEEIRMKYRYLDLRKKESMDVIVKRHEFISFIRDYLNKRSFVEVETPILSKSTPEGARDYLVPSRLQQGCFYALPQSPQQYKQLLMIGGTDRYFQIAKCFRDEDTRGDRQAEFTQLDVEMSFVEIEDVLSLTEEMFTKAIDEIFPEKKLLAKPWPRLDYDDVMLRYGTDKPDLRFGLEIQDLSELVDGCDFKVFADAISEGGVVRAICAKGAAEFSRAQIDELTELARENGAKGLAYIVVEESGLKSPILKFLGDEMAQKIVKLLGAEKGDIIFFGADKVSVVRESLSAVRNELGKRLDLIDENIVALAFVKNFPLFEEEKENDHYAPSHHMFTSPRKEDIELLEKSPGKVKSYQYDIVANGYEVGGGSIRIHDRKLQEKVFDLIGFDDERKKMFSHFLRAFEYGVPPHGGIAPGIDRMLMVLMGKKSIRDVMAFPKTGDGRDLAMEAPSEVEQKQLDELHIQIEK